MAAFLAMVALLITVDAVGLRTLGAVNRSAETLVILQRKIAAYRQIQHDTTSQLYSVATALSIPNEQTLEATVDQRIDSLVGDGRKIKQVLLNLLSNAVKFTPEGGRIRLKAALADGSVEISVSDTGVGIAPQDQDAIFEEFRQVGGDSADLG